MALSPRKWLSLFWLWLTLATVLIHALAPVGSPIARTSGSAFSASTHEVALAPSRAEAPAKARAVQDGGGDDLPSAGDPPLSTASPALHSPAIAPAARIAPLDLPPRHAATRQPFDARAPPRA